MRTLSALFCLLAACAAPLAHADLAAIHESALPQEPKILAALKDARLLEPCSAYWQPTWHCDVPKDAATKRLQTDLETLEAALKAHPENLELQLLTGQVAHYGYNLDVPGSPDLVTQALDKAHALAPQDFRASWFQASFLCQTNDKTLDGAKQMLAIEGSVPEEQLPGAFWSDYFECAYVANMPAHALRAAAHMQALHAPQLERWQPVINAANARFTPYDPAKRYSPAEAWETVKAHGDVISTSRLCGVRFVVHSSWGVQRVNFENGSCVANFYSGPYKATTRDLRPGILVMVQQPKAGESLDDYLKKFLKDGSFTPFTPAHCPAQHCLGMQGVQTGIYKADGDGHGRIIVFERDEPAGSGIYLESPSALPATQGSGPQAFHPLPVQKRIPGKLYYLVLLDTAASIEEPALKDYDFFVEHMQVE